jgi:hypothetical protein
MTFGGVRVLVKAMPWMSGICHSGVSIWPSWIDAEVLIFQPPAR